MKRCEHNYGTIIRLLNNCVCSNRLGAGIRANWVLFGLIALLVSCQNLIAQQEGFFDVTSVIKETEKRFKLTSTDVRCLVPLIKKENNDLLIIYVRFGGDEPEYALPLWEQVAKKRIEFEDRMNARLSKRQRTALRSARSSLELRIVTFIVQDFVDYLGENLDLDQLEFEAVGHLYEMDADDKYQLMVKGLRDSRLLGESTAAITKRTEYWMGRILPPDRFRVYRLLVAEKENFLSS